MTQYMLSVHHDGSQDFSAIPEEKLQKMFADVGAFNTELQESGSWVFAGGLMPIEVSTTVDATGAEAVLTDGPFSESKEFLGGFWIIDVADLDAALDWAKKGSAACQGKVEVRPFQEEPS